MIKMLDACYEDRSICPVFVAHLVAFVDLREPGSSRSGSASWKRLGWWERLVGAAVAASTPGRDDSGVWSWVRSCSKASKGFLGVLLRWAGVTREEYESLERATGSCAKLLKALDLALGPERLNRNLSPAHEERLRQLGAPGESIG